MLRPMIRPTLRHLARCLPCITLLAPAIASANTQQETAPSEGEAPVEAAPSEPTYETPPAATASAAASMSSDMVERKRFRLTLGTEVMGLTYLNPVEVGTFTDKAPNTTIFGLGAARVGVNLPSTPLTTFEFGFGYLINEQLIVGVEVFLGGTTASSKGQNSEINGGSTVYYDYKNKTSAFGGGLIPYIHYIFTTEGPLRPFAEFRFGFGGVRNWNYSESQNAAGSSATRVVAESITPTVGLGGGVHLFLSDAVSLDLGLTFDYMAPYQRPVKTTIENPDGDTTTNANADYQKSSNAFNLGFPLGISIWM